MSDFAVSLKEEAKRILQESIINHKLDAPKYMKFGQRDKIKEYLGEILQLLGKKYRIDLNAKELDELKETIVSEVVGFGVIDGFIKDPSITDIFVNSPDQIYVEKRGQLEKADIKFADNEEILFLIDKMILGSGRRIDQALPFVDFKLTGGIRVTAVIPPITAGSPMFSIRKMLKEFHTFDDLKRVGTLNDKTLKFIEYCVKAKLNILVSGSTGAGKTTMVNLMINEFIPRDERVILIEDVEEMPLSGSKHHLKILTRPANLEGKGEIDMRDLVKLALHLRPDRLMIGEVRGAEAFHFLHALNTGHEGSMCTVHATNPEDALNRLEVLALMDKPNIQPTVIRRFLELGIDMIIHMTRLSTGQRVISSIAEFSYQGEACVVKEIFHLVKHAAHGKEVWETRPTGIVPSFMEKLKAKTDIPDNFFQA